MCFYVIANIDLADFGRKEIELAEGEMPGLMMMRKKVWRGQTTERSQDCRLSAHDSANCCANRKHSQLLELRYYLLACFWYNNLYKFII